MEIESLRDVILAEYGIGGKFTRLPGYENPNYRLTTSDREYVVKLKTEQVEFVRTQTEILDLLSKSNSRLYHVPEVIRTTNGKEFIESNTGILRVFSFVPGSLLAHARPLRTETLTGFGSMLGHLNVDLANVTVPTRDLDWDLKHTGRLVSMLEEVSDPIRRKLAEKGLEEFASTTGDRLGLPEQVIHNDANDYNVLVGEDGQISGLIDFDDLVHTWRISELAIACSYAMMHDPNPLVVAGKIVAAYHKAHPLTEQELSHLFILIRSRWCMCGVMAEHWSALYPENKYISVSAPGAWEMLETFHALNPRFATYYFRSVCGLESVPNSSKVSEWLSQVRAHPLCDVIAGKTTIIDLSPGSNLAKFYSPADDVIADTALIQEKLQNEGADMGLGRYLEPRICYNATQYHGSDGTGIRSVHLGVDLFAKAGTAIHAPLDGTVHGVANNDRWLDFGPTVIMSHQTPQGIPFYSLYGHLSTDSLEKVRVGDTVQAGNIIGVLGTAKENGGWPPHLHFQIITDMLDNTGQFYGVGSAEMLETWRSLAPSPAPLLKMDCEYDASIIERSGDLLRKRQSLANPALSLSYRDPLHIIRGIGTKMIDAAGRTYLDCVNNVCHVGHAHPAIVEAVGRQQKLLNTNTRYLHDNILQLAERLLATLPDSLEVCTFVNSGSEANDLALRMARAHTDATDVIVVDGAYHGHTNALIEISPYKYKGRGGKGRAEFVHELPLPDPVREHPSLADALRQLGERITKGSVSSFWCESLLSCGGQIELPQGYLQEIYAFVRDLGAVCIADEVQVGFGRVGDKFWGFETQGVVPDIVTMGKPFGNGHPLAAVVTTRAIAESFNNGMEYFNTFGGNPVSCAAGLAVLDVIKGEGLQENARVVGSYLTEQLAAFAEACPNIIDVRGRGLFLGVEFVKAESTDAHPKLAARIVDACKHRGVLLSTDGPRNNVIKIKPPICFDEEDARTLVATLRQVLDFMT